MLLILFLLVFGVALLSLAARWRLEAGLPAGRLVSVDLERQGRPSPVLTDERLGLTGRPDFLVETRQGWIPVELKSGHPPAQPHLSHRSQLAAYCRLVHSTYGKRPPYGIVQYPGRGFAVPYTPSVEHGLEQTVAQMREAEGTQPDRSHDSRARCLSCGYQRRCDQSLAPAES